MIIGTVLSGRRSRDALTCFVPMAPNFRILGFSNFVSPAAAQSNVSASVNAMFVRPRRCRISITLTARC
ncbi:MAG: hypothetical protein ACU85U_20195, partial [Gammaproteobacteria bacterium]